MARTLKEETYNAKRSEILDIALQLVYSKGYSQMTIQDILDGLQISKGAFYHYFDSKQALLEGLVDRMGQVAMQTLLPVVWDPNLPALKKLRRYFEAGAQWKSSQREFIVNLMRIWYTDDNALIRQKMYSSSLQQTPRLLEPIIRQGIDEGVFTTRYPEQAAVILAGLGLTVGDLFSEMIISPTVDEALYQKSARLFETYVDAYERILGAPQGSLKIFDLSAFKEWFGAGQPEPEPQSK
jgi:TetR/AcrR family transcriptional regulator, transcriptional repressor for nem operon